MPAIRSAAVGAGHARDSQHGGMARASVPNAAFN